MSVICEGPQSDKKGDKEWDSLPVASIIFIMTTQIGTFIILPDFTSNWTWRRMKNGV